MFLAEVDEGFAPRDASASLDRSGPIVKTRMDNTAIVAGLMLRDLRLLFEYKNFPTGMGFGDLECRCQSDDAAANDREIVESGHTASVPVEGSKVEQLARIFSGKVFDVFRIGLRRDRIETLIQRP